MVKKIIIITTAICRIDIHSQVFPAYRKFLGDNYKIKWFINIDQPLYCQDSLQETYDNLYKLLDSYDITIFCSDKPNFFNSVKRLIHHARKCLDDDTYLLWLEDDWLPNSDHKLEYFIETYGKDTSFISLVYNMLGSFPPFIMGPKLATRYFYEFMNYNCPLIDPEKISRKILRKIAKNMGIIYFNQIENINQIYNISNPIIEGLLYTETYLTIPNNIILCETPINSHIFPNHTQLFINNLKTYTNIKNTDKIIFLRFGTFNSNKLYKTSHFRDIGRNWKSKLC